MSRVTQEIDGAARDGPGDEDLPPLDRGMVATSHPAAVHAAVEVLRRGGNAVDAAVCAALVLGVVEPMSTGLGGDAFALAWREDERRLLGLNASGRAPAAASLDALGAEGVPGDGPRSITVPGALDGYARLLERAGTWSLGDLAEPAIRLARDGFEVTPVVASLWSRAAPRLEGRTAAAEAYLPGGRPPQPGERFRQPVLGSALEGIARDGPDALYRGELGRAIAAEVQRLGGWLAPSDLEAHHSEWVEPLEGFYRGHPVYELPPNGQGVIVLEALQILEELPLPDMPAEERAHVTLEAVKLAFADALATVADPAFAEVPIGRLLDPGYTAERAAQIGERAMEAPVPGPSAGDTAYVAVVDGHGHACSLIHSLYEPFGSGVVVPGTGLCLHNRGALFAADPRHPNALAPGKRPYHTILPAMAFRADRPWLVFGVVGGFQQPQAQVQILSQLIDLGQEPQTAVVAPRFRWVREADVRLEEGFDPEVRRGLDARGHRIVDDELAGGFGAAQLIAIDVQTRQCTGASDPRKDGCWMRP